jgi:hypothetical protein
VLPRPPIYPFRLSLVRFPPGILAFFAEHLSRDILGKRRRGVLLGIYDMVFLITIYMIVQFILSG